MNRQVLFIDFCDTLVPFQTADDYCYQLVKSTGRNNNIFKICKLILSKFRMISSSNSKKLVLSRINGISEKKIEEFTKKYVKFLLEETNNEVRKLINKYQKAGYYTCILSGGYDCYLKPYAEKLDIDQVIASELEIKNGIATGKIHGLDCMGENKLVKLSELEISINNLSDCAFITDHHSDLPLLSKVGNGIIVVRGSNIPAWTLGMGFDYVSI